MPNVKIYVAFTAIIAPGCDSFRRWCGRCVTNTPRQMQPLHYYTAFVGCHMTILLLYCYIQNYRRLESAAMDSNVEVIEQLVVCGVLDRWSDIVGFSRNRKLFGIDTTLSVKPFHFQLVSFSSVTFMEEVMFSVWFVGWSVF